MDSFVNLHLHSDASLGDSIIKVPDLVKKLEEYEFIKIDATNTNDPEIRKLLKQYDIPGLPAYLILQPE